MRLRLQRLHVFAILAGISFGYLYRVHDQMSAETIARENITSFVKDMSNECWIDNPQQQRFHAKLTQFCNDDQCDDYFQYLCSFGKLKKISNVQIVREAHEISAIVNGVFESGDASLLIRAVQNNKTKQYAPSAVIVIKDIDNIGILKVTKNSSHNK